MKPVTPKIERLKKPYLKRHHTSPNINFSFKDWRQINNFGLGQEKPKWFASMLDAIKNMSTRSVRQLEVDKKLATDIRYHPIDWNAKKCPLKRSQIDWVEPEIIQNEEEFTFYQFQISKGKGRIIGYWFPVNTFNIVLLDPLHNLQPAADYNYKIDHTSTLLTPYESMLKDFEEIKSMTCENESCTCKKKLEEFPRQDQWGDIFLIKADQEICEFLNKVSAKHSVHDLLEFAMIAYDD